jgi:hypothetical protein
MPRAASSKTDKLEHPQSHYATPDELIEDQALSFEEKCDALKIWERPPNAHSQQRGHAGQRGGYRSEQSSHAGPDRACEG